MEKRSKKGRSKVEKKFSSAFDKMKGDENMKKGFNWVWVNRLYVASAMLMLVGLIVMFYYMQIGGAFIGLAVGLSFFDELNAKFALMKEYWVDGVLLKKLMMLGVCLFLLFVVPLFIVALFVGYLTIYLLRSALG